MERRGVEDDQQESAELRAPTRSPKSLYNREEVRGLVARGARLVDVLPREDFEELHLPGAISIPLEEIDDRATEELDVTKPVIVYCNDFL
ncbi:MAG: rhodanese-like domain-containing protein [Acidimicrobiia bacterium]